MTTWSRTHIWDSRDGFSDMVTGDHDYNQSGATSFPAWIMNYWSDEATRTHQVNGNLLDNRRRCEQSDLTTSWRHFSSVDVAPRKRLCTFFYRIYPKKALSIPASCRFFIRKKSMRYFGTRINWKQPQKYRTVTTLAAPRRGLVQRVPHWDRIKLKRGKTLAVNWRGFQRQRQNPRLRFVQPPGRSKTMNTIPAFARGTSWKFWTRKHHLNVAQSVRN
jgi:hypothetical protein